MLSGPTGYGKSTVSMAMAWAGAAGKPFLHWRGSGRPRRILYIDSEMSPPHMAAQIKHATRRLGKAPEGLVVWSKMLVSFPPLNTPEGQAFMDKLIAKAEPEFIFFDNKRYLLTGDLSKPETWANVSPWVMGLTSRRIGQMWINHTGWNGSHGYGDSSVEWNFDTSMLMVPPAKRPAPGTLDFTLRFTKNRTATAETAAEYREVRITLRDDRWSNAAADSEVSKTPRSHTAILKAMAGFPDGAGYTELEKASGVAHTTYVRAMDALVCRGVVGKLPSGLYVPTADFTPDAR